MCYHVVQQHTVIRLEKEKELKKNKIRNEQMDDEH